MRLLLVSTALVAVVTALPKPKAAHSQERDIIYRPAKRQAKVIPVVVGGPQDTFVPNSVTAAVGDIIQFQFANGNHTVSQSSADIACTQLEGGVYSGHIPFVDAQTDVGTFNMPVTTAEPMFLFCATGPHCQEGQVMVLNPTSGQQVLDYTKLSQATTKSVDGTTAVGGTAARIALTAAAFSPAPVQDAAAPPPAEAPPAPAESAAPAASSAPAAASDAPAAAASSAAPIPAVLTGILS
ncbi:hypothetical protein P154DRAFT_516486 [Amniculicola lignicola CBS 123094]|uniref:Cupredoxin n=1 Tax=Amniculicola lignicola CBS 123094 TaxID=1392246 RepID=A0A6A5X3Z9_9PLEO|nr:hypothetical protein P154DRAFT_516486 [Amniculicola lignicola CBS 123094]